MLVLTPFALSFVTLRGVFMHFLELTYVTTQDFSNFGGNFFAFVLLEMIGNSQGFRTFESI
jgi:hypothetical protein